MGPNHSRNQRQPNVRCGTHFEEGGEIDFERGVRPISRGDRPILEVYGIRAAFGVRHGIGPGFVAREGQNGRKDFNQRAEDVVDRGLRGSALRSVSPERVETVF